MKKLFMTTFAIAAMGLAMVGCGGSNEATIKVEDGSKIEIGGDEDVADGVRQCVQVENGEYVLTMKEEDGRQDFVLKVKFKKIIDLKGTDADVEEAMEHFSWNPELLLLTEDGTAVENDFSLSMQKENLDKDELRKFVRFMITADKDAVEEFVFTDFMNNSDLASTVLGQAAGFKLKFHGNGGGGSYSSSSSDSSSSYDDEYSDYDVTDGGYADDDEADDDYGYGYGDDEDDDDYSSASSSSSSSSNNWDAVLDEYEEYVDDLIAAAKKIKNGDMTAAAEMASISQKATSLASRLQNAKNELTSAQITRLGNLASKAAQAAQAMQ